MPRNRGCPTDFDIFIRDRARLLLDLVEKATGKAVVGRDAEDIVELFGGSLIASEAAEAKKETA